MNMYQPGWYPDPYGRFARRYHDGRAWTEHVADLQGTQARDAVPVAGTSSTSTLGPDAGSTVTFGPGTTGGTSLGTGTTGSGATTGGATTGGAPGEATSGGWAQPSVGWQAPTGRPPTTGFAPPGEQLWTTPGATAVWPTTAAPPETAAARRGAAWLGPLLAVAGAVLVVVGLLGLKWLDGSNRSDVGTYIKNIVDERNANPNVLSETWFRWGWVVGLVAGALALVAAFSANRVARIVGALLALLAALWALFGWLNFHAYLNNDSNNAALDLNRNISLREGGWLTVLGFLLLAVGALVGGPLGRGRRRVA